MANPADSQGYYSLATTLTDPADLAPAFEEFPRDLEGMVRAIQGLFIYDVVARDFYGVDIPAADTSSIHLRRVRDLARGVLAIDDRPLTCFRPPARRLPGRCHHYMLLLTAALRRTGTPARARCGFADLSRNPDAHFVGLRDTYRHDEWLRVPDTVVNALLGHPEPAR